MKPWIKRTLRNHIFLLSSGQALTDYNYARYYQGLSFIKTGISNAFEYFNTLISEGDKQLKSGSEVDYFCKIRGT